MSAYVIRYTSLSVCLSGAEGSADLAYDGIGRVTRPHLLYVSETSSLCRVYEEQSGLVGRQSLTTGCQLRPRSREYSNSTATEEEEKHNYKDEFVSFFHSNDSFLGLYLHNECTCTVSFDEGIS